MRVRTRGGGGARPLASSVLVLVCIYIYIYLSNREREREVEGNLCPQPWRKKERESGQTPSTVPTCRLEADRCEPGESFRAEADFEMQDGSFA